MSSRSVIAKLKREMEDLRLDGRISPDRLVDWAEANPDSELYSSFQWDDAVAGREYRIWQAREMIQNFTVTVGVSDEILIIPQISIPSLRGTDAGSYVSEDVVSSNEQYRLEVLEEEKSKLRSVANKYHTLLPELQRVWDMIYEDC